MLDAEDINAILEIMSRAPIKGAEAIAVAIVQQKLKAMLPKEEKTPEVAEIPQPEEKQS